MTCQNLVDYHDIGLFANYVYFHISLGNLIVRRSLTGQNISDYHDIGLCVSHRSLPIF